MQLVTLKVAGSLPSLGLKSCICLHRCCFLSRNQPRNGSHLWHCWKSVAHERHPGAAHSTTLPVSCWGPFPAGIFCRSMHKWSLKYQPESLSHSVHLSQLSLQAKHLESAHLTRFCCCRSSPNPEEFPSGFGLDLQQQNLVKCADSKCLACRLSWDKCTECDKLSGWYLRDHLCIDLQKMPAGKGPQHDTGRVVECAAPGCLSCATDFQQCQRCDPFLGWFLDKKQQRCKQIQDFSPNEGKDPATFSVTNCIEPGCSDCKDDYRFCKSDSGSAGSLKIKKVKYLTKRKLAEVVFDSPVLLNFEGSFWDEFSVTIIHLKNNSQIRCQMPQSLAAEASCSETITPTGFKIQVSTDFEVVLGEIRINSKSFTSGGKNSPIYSKYTSEQFREFPIVVGGFSTSDSKFFSIVSSAVSFVSLSRPVLSLALGVVSLDAMIYFDRTFVHLYYLALLEGAHLVLPQQVFETIMSPSNILPEKWLPTREQLSLFGPLSTCIPSRTLANQDFECSMLAKVLDS